MLVTAFSLRPVPPASGALRFHHHRAKHPVLRVPISIDSVSGSYRPGVEAYTCPAVGAHSGSS